MRAGRQCSDENAERVAATRRFEDAENPHEPQDLKLTRKASGGVFCEQSFGRASVASEMRCGHDVKQVVGGEPKNKKCIDDKPASFFALLPRQFGLDFGLDAKHCDPGEQQQLIKVREYTPRLRFRVFQEIPRTSPEGIVRVLLTKCRLGFLFPNAEFAAIPRQLKEFDLLREDLERNMLRPRQDFGLVEKQNGVKDFLVAIRKDKFIACQVVELPTAGRRAQQGLWVTSQRLLVRLKSFAADVDRDSFDSRRMRGSGA